MPGVSGDPAASEHRPGGGARPGRGPGAIVSRPRPAPARSRPAPLPTRPRPGAAAGSAARRRGAAQSRRARDGGRELGPGCSPDSRSVR